MKPAHQTEHGERVSVAVLLKDGQKAGRLVSSRSRACVTTTTLTLYAIDGGQKFQTETERGQYCPESDLLALILKGWGHDRAAYLAEMGQGERAFELLGLRLVEVL